MGGQLHPAVAAVRRAVRTSCADLEPGQRVIVACSGGADSTALAAAAAFESRATGWLVGAAVVDHQLQDGSADVAVEVRERLRGLRCDPVEILTVVGGCAGWTRRRRTRRPVRRPGRSRGRRRGRRPARPHAGRPGGNRPARAGPRQRPALPRGHGDAALALPSAVPGDHPATDAGRLPGHGPRRSGTTHTTATPVRPGPGTTRGAAGPGAHARPGGGRGARPDR